MKKGKSTGNPTKEEQKRMDAIRELGCLVHWVIGYGYYPTEVHHLTLGDRHGQKRLGHLYTVGLSSWNHRGVLPDDCKTVEEAEKKHGYSLAITPKKFREEYGRGLVLWEVQNELLKAML